MVRLLKRFGRAIASIHDVGIAHGRIGPTTLVIDDGLIPTIMVAGLGPLPETTSGPADDVAAVLEVGARLLGCEPRMAALARAMLGDVPPPPLAEPTDGNQLFDAVDAVEVALLRARDT
jgi:hypothetical protein